MIVGTLTASCGGCDRTLTVDVRLHGREAQRTLIAPLFREARHGDPLGDWTLADPWTGGIYCPHCLRLILLGCPDEHMAHGVDPRIHLDWPDPIRARPRDVLAHIDRVAAFGQRGLDRFGLPMVSDRDRIIVSAVIAVERRRSTAIAAYWSRHPRMYER